MRQYMLVLIYLIDRIFFLYCHVVYCYSFQKAGTKIASECYRTLLLEKNVQLWRFPQSTPPGRFKMRQL